MIEQANASSRRRSSLILVLVGSLLAIVAGESLVRVLVRTDTDGNFWLGGAIVGPRRPQLERLTKSLEEFETRPDELIYVYDPELGWKYRPGAASDDGRYHVDARGIRTGSAPHPTSEGPIIALYGGPSLSAARSSTRRAGGAGWSNCCPRAVDVTRS